MSTPFTPPREVFNPIQPIDLLLSAKQAAREKLSDRELVGQFSAAVDELCCLLTSKTFVSPPPAAPTVRLADVPQRGVEWLWPGRIPLGKITLLAGDPGVGKSLITLDIAARVSTGASWPDGEKGAGSSEQGEISLNALPIAADSMPHAGVPAQRVGSVLLLSAEDDLADTIRPRLEALDADCSRITALTSARTTRQPPRSASPSPTPSSLPPAPCSFDLSRDVALLDRTLESLPDCALVIIDPISAYLGRAVENVNAEVRRIMAPLAELAERRRVAVVVVSHLRKQAGAAIHRSIGSLAFVSSARTAWLVTKDSKTAVDYTPERRLLVPIKNNIAPDMNGLACSIETHPHTGLPIVRWSSESLNMDADAALTVFATKESRPAAERREASRWLRAQLAAGPRPTNEISETAAAHGFSIGTLRRAFRDLGGVAVRTGYGTQGQWHWRLPA
jgi:putative DNA primase/helicase